MTLFGIIWLFILLIYFLRFDLKKMAFLTIFSMVLQCSNVIVIDSVMVGPHIITNIVFIILYALKKHSHIIKMPTGNHIIVLSIFAVIIISSIINNSLNENLLKIIQIFAYMISFILMGKMSNEFNSNEIYYFLKKLSIFVLIIGFIQFVSTSGFIPRIPIISELFFNDHSTNVYYWHNNYSRFTSVFMEPSYCSCFLVGGLFYFISVWDKGKKNYALIFFLAIALLLTKSSSGYAALAICTFLFMIASKNKKVKKIFFPVAIIGCIILLVFFRETLNEVIFSKSSSGSAITRYYWNLSALNAFNSSKILGTGYKSLRASSLIYSLLGELGVAGLITYGIFNLKILIPLFKKSTYTNLTNAGIRFSILAIIIVQIIAVPDLDLCIYWLFLDIFALYNMQKKETGEKHND